MRRNLDKPSIPWRVSIPAEDKIQLVALLPMRGVQAWLIEKGLESFLNLMEANPPLRRWAKGQIAHMMYSDDREYSGIKLEDINVEIRTALYVRFGKIFPEIGAGTWFIRKFVRAFVLDLAASGPSLEEQIESTVNRVMTPEPEPESQEVIHQGPDE